MPDKKTPQLPSDSRFFTRSTLLVFFMSILTMVIYNYRLYQSIFVLAGDSMLYLSVAQNFVHTGHFIQNSRLHEVNMVVPPGVPLLLTLVLAMTHTYGIIIFQYVLFGLSAVLLSKAAGTFSKAAACLAPLLFVSSCVYAGSPNPSTLMTETYYIFLMCLSLFLFFHPSMSNQKKVLLLVPVLFYTLLVRPVLGALLGEALAVMAVFVLQKKIPAKRLVAYLVSFAAILAVNTCVNYRETGHLIMLEDYGASAVYIANNPNASTDAYNLDLLDELVDDYYREIESNPDLDRYQKNVLEKERASEFISENLPLVLKNAAIKYKHLYLPNQWNWNFLFLFISFAVLFWKKKLSLPAVLLLVTAFCLSTIPPAFGLYSPRYSTPCIPFYTLFNGILYGLAGEAVWRWLCWPKNAYSSEEAPRG